MQQISMFDETADMSATGVCAWCGYQQDIALMTGMVCADVEMCAERRGVSAPTAIQDDSHKHRLTGAMSFHAPFVADEKHGLKVARVPSRVANDTCRAYHYSGQCTATNVSYGFWEDGKYQGIIAFLPPNVASPSVAAYFERLVNAKPGTGYELSRIALVPQAERRNPTTRYMSLACAAAARDFPEVSILYSYADPAYGHDGTLYRAASWIPIDAGGSASVWKRGASILHTRTSTGATRRLASRMRAMGYEIVDIEQKHRFIKPMTRAGRKYFNRHGHKVAQQQKGE